MSEWISVLDRLPDFEEPVWVYWKDSEVLIGWRIYKREETQRANPYEGWYSWEDNKYRWASWWMPIEPKPEPPK